MEAFLRASYWASERPRHLIEQSTQNSLPFGVYRKRDGLQVGFCRIVTDYTTFGWVADVFIDPEHRGTGLGKALMQAVVDHPQLRDIRLVLSTRDAQGLYEQSGFKALSRLEQWMIRADEKSTL